MKQIKGDILNVKKGYILHQCNCKTTKGKGLSEKIFSMYPETSPYRLRLENLEKRDNPGTIYICQTGDIFIVNLFGQIYPGKPRQSLDDAKMRQGYFKQGLESFLEFLKGAEGEIEISIPYKIGCGLAGGDWVEYKKMLQSFEEECKKNNLNVKITLYEL